MTMNDDALLPSFDTLAEAALLLVEEAAVSEMLAKACQHDVDFVVGMLDTAIVSGATRAELDDLADDLDRMREQVRQQRQGAEMWSAVCDRAVWRMAAALAATQYGGKHARH